MNILLTLNKTDILGGSVIWAYTVCEELLLRGHDVYLQVWQKGRNHHRFTTLGCKDHTNDIRYNLIIGNHLSRFPELNGNKIINVCHGAIVELEKPDPRANRYIAISAEVRDSLSAQGHNSQVLHNPVNLDRYKPNGKGSGYLSLCQGEKANNLIKQACDKLGVKVTFHNKYNNPVWDLWNEIPKYELVFSLGRGVYESLACDKPVIVMDSRDYTPAYGDGYLSDETYVYSLYNNCSGRGHKHPVTLENIMKWISQYKENKDTVFEPRLLATIDFDVKNVVDELLL
jgi:hypothetical protein